MKDVIKIMSSSPTAAYLRDCTLHQRMMLAALLKVVRREGVDEVPWGEVFITHVSSQVHFLTSISPQIQRQHLIYATALAPSDSELLKPYQPTPHELRCVLDTLVASRALLVEEGPIAARKAENDRRVVLNLEVGEVERVLGEVGGKDWVKVLSS